MVSFGDVTMTCSSSDAAGLDRSSAGAACVMAVGAPALRRARTPWGALFKPSRAAAGARAAAVTAFHKRYGAVTQSVRTIQHVPSIFQSYEHLHTLSVEYGANHLEAENPVVPFTTTDLV